ncbi:hypothetical protein AVEN_95198-1 [Araneus ventricosus]|uniref:Uncharacterized protein n=1 Tax=Araneus ventricosus TaxID=182803 RepID=A0A4Y2J8R0_ARAVE|nr:hypothetical protein AVEN_95198-1 [Araneus ventricosus]
MNTQIDTKRKYDQFIATLPLAVGSPVTLLNKSARPKRINKFACTLYLFGDKTASKEGELWMQIESESVFAMGLAMGEEKYRKSLYLLMTDVQLVTSRNPPPPLPNCAIKCICAQTQS